MQRRLPAPCSRLQQRGAAGRAAAVPHRFGAGRLGEARLRREAGGVPGNRRGHGRRGADRCGGAAGDRPAPVRCRLLPLAARGIRYPRRTGRPGAGAARPWGAPQFRRDGGGRARERARPPARRAACVGRPPGRRQAAGSLQARPHRGGRRAGRSHACRDAGEGGSRRGRDPGLTGAAGGAGRDDHLRDGAAGRAAPRPVALLRPGIARGFLPRARRWRGGGIRALADRARDADRARHGRRSSSTSTWC